MVQICLGHNVLSDVKYSRWHQKVPDIFYEYPGNVPAVGFPGSNGKPWWYKINGFQGAKDAR